MPKDLPIDVVPGTRPPRFRWRVAVGTAGGHGQRAVECEGSLPAGVERAVLALIGVAKAGEARCEELVKENATLKAQNLAMFEQLEARAEPTKPAAPPQQQPRKGTRQ